MGKSNWMESQPSTFVGKPPTGKDDRMRPDKFVKVMTRKKNPNVKPTSLQKQIHSDPFQKTKRIGVNDYPNADIQRKTTISPIGNMKAIQQQNNSKSNQHTKKNKPPSSAEMTTVISSRRNYRSSDRSFGSPSRKRRMSPFSRINTAIQRKNTISISSKNMKAIQQQNDLTSNHNTMKDRPPRSRNIPTTVSRRYFNFDKYFGSFSRKPGPLPFSRINSVIQRKTTISMSTKKMKIIQQKIDLKSNHNTMEKTLPSFTDMPTTISRRNYLSFDKTFCSSSKKRRMSPFSRMIRSRKAIEHERVNKFPSTLISADELSISSEVLKTKQFQNTRLQRLRDQPNYSEYCCLTELSDFLEIDDEIYESNPIAIAKKSERKRDKSSIQSLKKLSRIKKESAKALNIDEMDINFKIKFLLTDLLLLITIITSIETLRVVPREGQQMRLIYPWFSSLCTIFFSVFIRKQTRTIHNAIIDNKKYEKRQRCLAAKLREENSRLLDEIIALKAKQFRKKIIENQIQMFAGSTAQRDTSSIVSMVKTLKTTRLDIKQRLRGHILKIIMRSILLGNPKMQFSNAIDESSKLRPLFLNGIALSLIESKLKNEKLVTMREELLIHVLNQYGNSMNTVFRIICANILSDSLPANQRIFLLPENIEDC